MTHRMQLPKHLYLLSSAGLVALGLAGCRHGAQPSATASTDPAAANMAQPYTGGNAGGYGAAGPTKVLGQSAAYAGQSSSESYETQTPAPIIRRAPASSAAQGQDTTYYPVPQAQTTQARYAQGGANESQAYQNDPNAPVDGPYDESEQAGQDAITAADQAPPPLPEYDQPPAPADDYEWTPGYWNYAAAGYYWVPGAWVAPPFYGALWTPPYWGYAGNRWHLHRGYWGPHVGYYGGIDYGFGYIGTGYFGGYWNDRHFFYNRAVTNVDINNVHNVYNRTVVYNNVTYGPHSNDRVSYNGGRGGLDVQPRPQELAAMRENHFAPTAVQQEHRAAAAANRGQFFAENHGRPAQAFAGHPVGTLGSVGTPPRSLQQARSGEPAGSSRVSPETPATRGDHPAAAPAGHADTQPSAAGGHPSVAAGNRSITQPGNTQRAERQQGRNTPNGASQPGRASAAPESAPARSAAREAVVQPGTARAAERPNAAAFHLPTAEAPRAQGNNQGTSSNRSQPMQQRPDAAPIQHSYPAQERQQGQQERQQPELQNRPQMQQRPAGEAAAEPRAAQSVQQPRSEPAGAQHAPQAPRAEAHQGGAPSHNASPHNH